MGRNFLLLLLIGIDLADDIDDRLRYKLRHLLDRAVT